MNATASLASEEKGEIRERTFEGISRTYILVPSAKFFLLTTAWPSRAFIFYDFPCENAIYWDVKFAIVGLFTYIAM